MLEKFKELPKEGENALDLVLIIYITNERGRDAGDVAEIHYAWPVTKITKSNIVSETAQAQTVIPLETFGDLDITSNGSNITLALSCNEQNEQLAKAYLRSKGSEVVQKMKDVLDIAKKRIGRLVEQEKLR